MLANLAAAVGVLGVVGSLIFAGTQARELIRQRKLQNAIAGAAVSSQLFFTGSTGAARTMRSAELKHHADDQ